MDAFRSSLVSHLAAGTAALTVATWLLANPSPLSSLGLLALIALGIAAAVRSRRRPRSVGATSLSLGRRADLLGGWALGSALVVAVAAKVSPLQPLWVLVVPACVALTVLANAIGIAALVRDDDRRAGARGLAKAALPTLALAAVGFLVLLWILDPPQFTF